MAFVRFKHIKNKSGKTYSYLYLVKSYWDKDKKACRQKVIFYLGKVEGYDPFVVEEIFKRDGAKCKICGRQDNLIIDHLIPTSKGGTNDPKNLGVKCERCCETLPKKALQRKGKL